LHRSRRADGSRTCATGRLPCQQHQRSQIHHRPHNCRVGRVPTRFVIATLPWRARDPLFLSTTHYPLPFDPLLPPLLRSLVHQGPTFMAIKFKGVDFIELDTLLSDDERLVRDNTRLFIEENLVPIIEQCNRDGRFPKELIKPMGELGFYGASLQGYGCAGMSAVEYGLMTQELERGDSGVRSFVSVQSGLCMYPIYAFGSEEQKQKYLPKMALGEILGCFGLTEPDAGSNPGAMRTRAKNDRVRGFIVPTDTPGFKAADVHGKWSLRASVTSSLSLQDVRIPADCLLPGSKGLGSPLSCLNQARYGIAWGAIGAAMACYDCA